MGVTGDAQRHDSTVKQEHSYHNEEMYIMQDQHLKERFIEKQIYLLSVYADIEAYCQELNENLIQNNRDAERDMVDQRNQQLQTVLIAGTIMVSAIVGVLFQAAFPTDYAPVTYYLYSISIAISMLFLVISIILCIELLVRIYRFTYKRSHRSIQHLQRSLDLTNRIDREIAGSKVDTLRRKHRRKPNDMTTPQPLEHQHQQQHQKALPDRKLYSRLHAEEINQEFLKHEKQVENYFQLRDKLNYEIHSLAGGKKELSFETYWNNSCNNLNNIAIHSFYQGTAWNVIATAIFMYAYFDQQYLNVTCSYVIAIIMGISLIGMFLLVFMMQNDFYMKELYRGIQKAESEIVSIDPITQSIIFGNQVKLSKDFMKAGGSSGISVRSNNEEKGGDGDGSVRIRDIELGLNSGYDEIQGNESKQN